MTIDLHTPSVRELAETVLTMRAWPRDGAPVQLHPGDLGWNWSDGATATAAAARTWHRDGHLLAVGLLDGPGLVRLAIDPAHEHDDDLALQVHGDLDDPGRGVLPTGKVAVEARLATALQARLRGNGWVEAEPWTPLRRDLTRPVDDPGLRIETVGPELVSTHTSVHRSAFGSARLTDELWWAMAAGPAFEDARSLVVYDDDGAAVASATVWSAGPGRPGLLEPLGVHADHRGRGFGTAIALAAAAALRELGASSALVCTPSTNRGAVAAYLSAGFHADREARDLARSA